jgi:hypothetical protein
MAAPPLFVGADQDRLICVGDAVVAVKLAGEPGVLDDEDEEDAETVNSVDGLPAPIELIAETR